MTTTLIKNGRVISTTGVIAHDVLITDETVTALGAPGYFTEEGCDRVIDAAGKYVIPGGIDVHTHMEMPFGGTYASDTFETGTRAAAWGGVTTIVDMAVQNTGETCTPPWPTGIARPRANAQSTTPSIRSSAVSTTSR